MNDLLSKYLDLGWAILPIQPGGKIPLTANGFKDASNEPEQIEAWLRQFPNCNWAVSPADSKLTIIDIDCYKGITKADLEKVTGPIPETAWAQSPRGGIHIYFTGDSVPSRNGIIKGVDIRSSNGYILLPPSLNEEGKCYKWYVEPWDKLLRLPGRIAHFLENEPARNVLRETDSEELRLGPGDGRWEHLRMFAGRMRAWGWSQESIVSALLGFASTQCEADESISKSKIISLAKYICTKPTENTKEKINEPSSFAAEMVRVELDGKTYQIPSGQLSKALMKGAKLL